MRHEPDPPPHDIDEATDALARLPQLAEHLADMPEPALRRLYDALDLRVDYRPADKAVDVEITLTDTMAGTNETAPPSDPVGPDAQV